MPESACAHGTPQLHDALQRPAAHTFLTHTFSECVENHAGMETIGQKRKHGFTEAHLACTSTRLGAELHRLKV